MGFIRLLCCLLVANVALAWDVTGIRGTLKTELVEIIQPILDEHPLNEFLLKSRILRTLQSEGYYNPTVSIDSNLEKIHITLGTPTTIRSVEIIDNGITTDGYPLAVGSRFVHYRHEDGKTIIAENLSKQGYLDAVVEGSITLNKDKTQADVVLTIKPGRQYKVGTISWQQTGWSQKFLDRFIPQQTGDVFKQSSWNDLRKTMLSPRRFAFVDYQVIKEDDVDVAIVVENRPRMHVEAGIGAATDTGARVRFGLEIPRVTDWGLMTDLSVFYGERQQLWESKWIAPGLGHPTNEQWDAKLRYKWREAVDHKIRVANLGLDYKIKSGQHTYKVGLALQKDYSVFDRLIERSADEWLVPKLSWSHSKSGQKMDLELTGASSEILATRSFGKIVWASETKHDAHILDFSMRTKIGAFFGHSTHQSLLSKRFFAGGDASIRGFRVDTISPTIGPISNPLKIGGNKLIEYSLEARTKGKVGALAYVDMGDSFTNRISLKAAAGLGAFVRLPIGALEFSYAQPLREGEHGRVHFNVATLS